MNRYVSAIYKDILYHKGCGKIKCSPVRCYNNAFLAIYKFAGKTHTIVLASSKMRGDPRLYERFGNLYHSYS